MTSTARRPIRGRRAVLLCPGQERGVLLNSTGTEFMKLAWADEFYWADK
ncbi:hypothetical protein [Streptomyces hokutonensis]